MISYLESKKVSYFDTINKEKYIFVVYLEKYRSRGSIQRKERRHDKNCEIIRK